MRSLTLGLISVVALGWVPGNDAAAWTLSSPIAEDELDPTVLEVTLAGSNVHGLEITQSARKNGAGGLTLRLEVGLAPRSWEYLFLYREPGALHEIIPAAELPDDATTIWTDEIPGDVYQVGLQAPPGTEVTVKITGVAARNALGGPNAVFGSANFETLDQLADDPLEQVSHLLAGLLIDTNDINLSGRAPVFSDVCSGLMIAPDLLLTAAHCLLYDYETCNGVHAIFGMRHDSDEPAIIRRCTEVVYIGNSIDTALLRLDGMPSDGPFPRLTSTGPLSETRVRILQHPGGNQARVARDGDCKVQDQVAQLWPSSSRANPASTKEAGFVHHCDTGKGSSGAALLTADGRIILGIQHAGHADTGINLAVHAYLIRYCIGYQAPNNFTEPPNDVLCK